MPKSIEPRPDTFSIIPQYSSVNNQLVGFTVEDPEGGLIGKRDDIITKIHKKFPEATPRILNQADFKYFRYRVVINLKKTTKAGADTSGKPRPLTDAEILRHADEIIKRMKSS
jgi:hypothetical protein